MSLSLKPSQLPEELSRIVKAGLVPNILGSPGISKTDCVFQFSKANKLYNYPFTLSNHEPVDLSGYPMLNQETNRMMFAPPENLPLSTDKIPDGYNGFCLFLDELNASSRATASAAYKVILERKVGRHYIHPNTAIIAAGNLKTDKAIVNELGTAMRSRLVNIELSVSRSDWLSWANSNQIDQRIISFIKFRSRLLHNFNPSTTDNNFCCPRTWEFTSKYITGLKTISHQNLISIAGCIGEPAAIEFKSFCKLYKTIPTIEQIVADPENFKYKSRPDINYALTTMFSINLEIYPEEIVKAMSRLPIEFQVVSLREAIARNKSSINIPQVIDWISKNNEILY